MINDNVLKIGYKELVNTHSSLKEINSKILSLDKQNLSK